MKKRLTAAFIAITLMFGTTTSIATEMTEDYIDISESSDKFPNPRIEVGKKYQTYPSLVWNHVDGACGYDIWNKLEGRDEYSMAGATVNTSFEIRIGTSAPWVGKGMSSDSEIIKEVAIGARTEKCSGNAMIPPSQAAKLKCDINTKSKKGNKEYTAYRSELELFGEKYCVYTITGLPANHTAEFEYLVKGEDEWNYSHKVNEKREINSDGSFVFLAKENEMYDELCFKDREIDLKKDCFYISVFDSTVENNEVTEVTKTVYPVTINMKPNYTKTQEVSFEKIYLIINQFPV